MLRFFRSLGLDGTLVWVLVAWIMPAYVGSKASRKNPFWLLAIVPWAIVWAYPIGLLENPFHAHEYWIIGPMIYVASVLIVLELATENARWYVKLRDDRLQRSARKGRR